MNKLMHNIAVAVLMVFAIALSSLVHAYNGSMSNSAASSSSTQITTDIEHVVDRPMHHAIHQSKADDQSVSNHHADMLSKVCADALKMINNVYYKRRKGDTVKTPHKCNTCGLNLISVVDNDSDYDVEFQNNVPTSGKV